MQDSRLTVRTCPACTSNNATELFSVALSQFCEINSTYAADYSQQLHFEPSHLFPIVKCSDCGFTYAQLAPSPDLLADVYDKAIDRENGFHESHDPAWVGHQLNLASRLLQTLGQVFPNDSPLRVLDYGCGYGVLIRALSGPRIECAGLETSRAALDYLSSEGLAASSSLKDNQFFHGVFLSDVLEHVVDPMQVLVSIRDALTTNGVICVNVPIFSAKRMQALAGEVQQGSLTTRELNPLEHLNYFSAESLRSMLVSVGFKVIESEVDIGLRPNLKGISKVGNAVKSAVRLLRYGLDGAPTTGGMVLGQRLD